MTRVLAESEMYPMEKIGSVNDRHIRGSGERERNENITPSQFIIVT